MVKIQVNSQGKAYIANGKALETQRIAPVIEPLSVTPTTSSQTITVPSGTDRYSPINVAAVTADIDSDIKAINIKSGVSILGVSGTVTELNGETRTETLTSSAGNTFTPTSGKNAITSITVTPNNQNRNVTPSTSEQTLNVNSGYSGNGTISVSAVTSSIDANIQAGNIKKDVTILGITGTLESGIVPSGTLNITQNGNYDVTNYANANVNVSSGGGGSGTTDVPLTRFKDDNNNEIGTHYMNFEDANGNVFKVIVLDAQYRNVLTKWCSNRGTVTNMPIYNSNYNLWWYDNAKETATQNTQLILDYCSAQGYTPFTCNHCRSKSFTINGTTYYGQLPNIREVFDMWRHRIQIEQMDTSASSNSSTNFSSARWISSSNQFNSNYCWCLVNTGPVYVNSKDNSYFTCPILEIPA